MVEMSIRKEAAAQVPGVAETLDWPWLVGLCGSRPA